MISFGSKQASLGDSSTVKPKEIYPLTSIRFVAAIVVVVYHTFFAFLPTLRTYARLADFISAGWIAVDLFFVLSGFILSTVHLKGGRQLKFISFVYARLWRIYPLYIFSLAVDSPALIAHRFADGLSLSGTSQLTIQLMFYLPMLQAWVPMLARFWNLPGWSLSAEFFFYLVFPCLAPLVWKCRFPIILALTLWAAEMSVPLVNCYFIHSSLLEELLVWNPLVRLPAFLFGVLSARGTIMLENKAGPIASVSLALTVFLMAFSSVIPRWLLFGMTPLFGMIVASLSGNGGLIHRILSTRPFVVLGRASFAIYLLHYPVWRMFAAASGNGTLGGTIWQAKTEDQPFLYLAYVLTVISLAIIAHYLLEVPAQQWLSSRFASTQYRR